MRTKKNGIYIPYTDKELYCIFKDLEQYGRTSYSFDADRRKVIGTRIGQKCCDLIERNLLEHPVTNPRIHKSYIQLPIVVKVIEKKKSDGSFFEFLHI